MNRRRKQLRAELVKAHAHSFKYRRVGYTVRGDRPTWISQRDYTVETNLGNMIVSRVYGIAVAPLPDHALLNWRGSNCVVVSTPVFRQVPQRESLSRANWSYVHTRYSNLEANRRLRITRIHKAGKHAAGLPPVHTLNGTVEVTEDEVDNFVLPLGKALEQALDPVNREHCFKVSKDRITGPHSLTGAIEVDQDGNRRLSFPLESLIQGPADQPAIEVKPWN